MRKDVKQLADSMERGYKMLPVMNRGKYFERGSCNQVVACCAMGHAILGSAKRCNIPLNEVTNVQGVIETMFPIIDKQMVHTDEGSDYTNTLWWAITDLNDKYKWSTPQIVAWLRSHL